MPFPTTEAEFAAQGYKFTSRSHCRGCGAEIEWWTTPKCKMIPLDPGTLEPHWATCANAEKFRKKTP